MFYSGIDEPVMEGISCQLDVRTLYVKFLVFNVRT